MHFKKHIILTAATFIGFCFAASYSAHSQESAIDRIKDRLNRSATISPSEAREAAGEAASMAEASRRRSEAAIKAAEEGTEAPGTVMAGDEAGVVTGDGTPPPDETASQDSAEGDPDLPSVAGMDFGSENEDVGARDLFADPKFLESIGKDGFKYQSAGIADPMVFPQIRNDAIFAEIWAKHENLLKEAGIRNPKEFKNIDSAMIDKAKVTEAKDLLGKILEMKDPRFTEQTDKQIAALDQLANGVVDVTPNPERTPTPGASCELPDEIKANVRFIIAAPDGASYCLIGDYMVRAGDPVPDFPNVRLLSVEPGKAIFEISGSNCPANTTKEVTIAPNMDEGFFGKGGGISGKSLLGTGKKMGGGRNK